MNPEAKRVPLSFLAVLRAASLLLVETNQAIPPPTRSGRLSSRGINIPRENARAGTPMKVRAIAIIAPIPYRIQGAPPPDISGSITAAIAFA